MKMYMKNGYVNMRDIIHSMFAFIFGVGARGIGKSYNCWETLIDDAIETGKKFIYLRITEDEIDTVCTAESNPIDDIDKYKGRTVFKPINKHMKGIYLDDDKLIGITASLRTFAKVRGMSFKEYTTIFLDEFIREAHQNKLKHLGEALKQLYETVNRNRELEGEPPVKLICMSNALDFNNDILIEFDIIEVIRKMKLSKQEFYLSPERSLLVIYPQNSPISQKKKETALYKLGGSFNKMALNNEFREYFEGNVRSMNLKGFKPMWIYGTMCFYRSTNSDRIWYVTETRKGNFLEEYQETNYERIQFLKKHIILHDLYYMGKVYFESSKLEMQFTNLVCC